MTETVTSLLAILTVAAQVFLLGMVLLFAASRVSGRATETWDAIVEALGPISLWMAWGVALVATAGSLYFSEGAHYIPCEFCWFQRIAVYPMTVILGVAAFRKDSRVIFYALPLSLAGALISAYHYQLQRFPNQASQICDPLNPCSLTWVWKFHYISIPLMALSAGLLMATLVTLGYIYSKGTEQGNANANQSRETF